MATYTSIGGTEEHRDFRTTLTGVSVGSNGLCVLEVEEQRDHNPKVREYAEIAVSLDGARQLRDLLNLAILALEA